MLNRILATTALATVLSMGAQAQTTTGTEPATEAPATGATTGDTGTEPADTEGGTEVIVIEADDAEAETTEGAGTEGATEVQVIEGGADTGGATTEGAAEVEVIEGGSDTGTATDEDAGGATTGTAVVEPTTEEEVIEGTTSEGTIGGTSDSGGLESEDAIEGDAPVAPATDTAPEGAAPEATGTEGAATGGAGTESTGAADVETDGAEPAGEADMEAAPAEEPAEGAGAVTETEEVEVTEEAEPEGPMMDETLITEGFTAVDLTALSVDDLMGSDITNAEGENVATVEDVILTPDGQVESVVAKFGGFLGFGANTALLEMSEIAIVQDGEGSISVLTGLTPEDLESRPEYEG